MKRSTKLISLLLAVLMIAALLPTAALADDADTQSIGDTVGSVVDTVNGIKADWDTDGTYWGFYVDGEFSSVGVDSVDIPTDGSLNIAFNLEKDNG